MKVWSGPPIVIAMLVVANVGCLANCIPGSPCGDMTNNMKEALILAKASLGIGLGGDSCNKTTEHPCKEPCKDDEGKVCLVPCCVRPGTCCCICSPPDDKEEGDSKHSGPGQPPQVNVYPLPAYATLDPSAESSPVPRPIVLNPSPYPNYHYITYPYPLPSPYPPPTYPKPIPNRGFINLSAVVGGRGYLA